MKINMANILKYSVLLLIITCCSCKQKEEPLKEFNGRVIKVTSSILKVQNGEGAVITFDNRKVTYINGALLTNDSVCVSYKGELDNGTVSIIAELNPSKK